MLLHRSTLCDMVATGNGGCSLITGTKLSKKVEGELDGALFRFNFPQMLTMSPYCLSVTVRIQTEADGIRENQRAFQHERMGFRSLLHPDNIAKGRDTEVLAFDKGLELQMTH